jgi:hypothetical protein
MAAYIPNTMAHQTPVPVGPATGGGVAQQVAPNDATRLMAKLFAPEQAYWGGAGVTADDGIPFQGETEWMPVSPPIYVFSPTDQNIRWIKGT